MAQSLRERALAQRSDPLAFLADRALFGSLVEEPAFTRPYVETLERLHADGARATLAALTGAL
jgi:mannitol 2-dehydrogenase